MSRSKWKAPFVNVSLFGKDILLGGNPPSYVKKNKDRKSVITNFLVGKNIYVYNGKTFKKIYISREKVGFKLGIFSFTRKYTAKIITKQNVSKKKK
jgi:small subunit ribosomal protein S19